MTVFTVMLCFAIVFMYEKVQKLRARLLVPGGPTETLQFMILLQGCLKNGLIIYQKLISMAQMAHRLLAAKQLPTDIQKYDFQKLLKMECSLGLKNPQFQ